MPKTRVQGHHICYSPEWVVDLTSQMHRCISRIQNTKGVTPGQYARVTNFLHAVASEWNRMRQELDTGLDLRQKKPKPPQMSKKKKKGQVFKRRKR